MQHRHNYYYHHHQHLQKACSIGTRSSPFNARCYGLSSTLILVFALFFFFSNVALFTRFCFPGLFSIEIFTTTHNIPEKRQQLNTMEHTHTRVPSTRARARTHTRIHTHAHTHTHTHKHTYTHTHTHTHIHTHTDQFL